ncbi:MAG: tetratricopeptide repeat protein, partial [Cytophagales bacterium]|nr:tetratricopeptide repeat protein [Cytophagales bacterium]
MRLLCLFFFLSCLVPAWASTRVDSLHQALRRSTKSPQRVDILNQLAAFHVKNDPNKLKHYSSEALSFSIDLGYELGLSDAYLNLAEYYYERKMVDTALFLMKSALETYGYLRNAERASNAALRLAEILLGDGNYKAALQYANEAEKTCRELNQQEQLAQALSTKCEILHSMGNGRDGLNSCLESLKIFEKLEDFNGQVESLNRTGEILLRMGQFEKAEKYLEQAISRSSEIECNDCLAKSLLNFGLFHLEQSQHQEAIPYLTQALSIVRVTRNPLTLALCHFYLGRGYLEKLSFDSAQHYLLSANKAIDESHDLDAKAQILTAIGALYSRTKDYKKAITYFKNSLALAQRINAKPILKTCYHNLAKFYDKVGDQSNALIYFKLYMIQAEEIHAWERARDIAEIETLYSLEQNEKEIELLRRAHEESESRQERQIWVIYALALGLAVVIGVLVIIWSRYNYLKRSMITTPHAVTASA